MEVDGSCVGARSGARGRGCGKQAAVAAVERGTEAAPGRLCPRAVPGCGPGACSAFAEEHVGALSRVLTDGWQGARAGPAGWPAPGQGPFDPGGPEAALPTCRHAMSNSEAFVLGTFRGASLTRFQGLCDEFAWRYSHRGRAAALDTPLAPNSCEG